MIDSEVVSILSLGQLLRRWVSKLNLIHNYTTLLGLTRSLNLLPNIVECLSKCLVIKPSIVWCCGYRSHTYLTW